MSDSWEYRVLWEYAGLTPPSFHEDELESIIGTIGAITDGIWGGHHAVSAELKRLEQSGISSSAFDALNSRWHDRGGQALVALATTLSNLADTLGRALTEIYEWKARLVVAVGLADMGLTIYYVGTLGVGALAEHAGGGVLRAELRHRLESMVDQLEAKLISAVIDGTPLKSLQSRVAGELQKLIDEVIDTAGAAAGSYVGGQ